MSWPARLHLAAPRGPRSLGPVSLGSSDPGAASYSLSGDIDDIDPEVLIGCSRDARPEFGRYHRS